MSPARLGTARTRKCTNGTSTIEVSARERLAPNYQLVIASYYNSASMRVALSAAACFTPLRRIDDPLLLIEDGSIVFVCPRREAELPAGTRTIDFPGALLAPGYVDLHVHGGAGYDVMGAGRDELAEFERHLARHGTTTYLPTTVTAPVEDTCAALGRIRLPARPLPGALSHGD